MWIYTPLGFEWRESGGGIKHHIGFAINSYDEYQKLRWQYS